LIRKKTFKILALLIAAGVVIGGFVAFKRIQIEIANKNVELTIDYNDVKKMSAMEGLTTKDVLKKFKRIGVVTIALPEDIISSLEAERKIILKTGLDISDTNLVDVNPRFIYLVCRDKNLIKRIKTELSLSLGSSQVKVFREPDILEIKDDLSELETLCVGISPDNYKMISNIGFKVIPRLYNNYRLNNSQINKKLDLVKAYGPVDTIIFGGMQVLGFKNHLNETVSRLKEHNLYLGAVEFSKQKGYDVALYLMNDMIIKVHSIGEEEMEEDMTKPIALARFKRAVIERGVNLLYIRPFYMMEPGKSVIKTNIDYIADLRFELEQAGYSIGPAIHPADLKISNWQVGILSLAVVSAAFLLLSFYIDISYLIIYIALAAAFILSMISNSFHITFAYRSLLALIAACTFPTLAIIHFFQPLGNKSYPSTSKIILKIIGAFAVTSIGVVLITGLLGDVQYMLGSRIFSGIKIALLAPPLLIALYFFFLYPKVAGQRLKFWHIWHSSLDWFKVPLTVGYLVCFTLLSAAGAIYVLRSGNFSIGVFGFEHNIRSGLENIFAVRPRTKEFLVGYPIFVLAVYYYLKGGRTWLWLYLSLASISLISFTNTFCHAHSPLLLSVIRSFYGMLLGIFVGLIFLAIYNVWNWLYKNKISELI